jgi:hypothetical protein
VDRRREPLSVFEAIVASLVALVIFGIPASKQQHAYSPINAEPPVGIVVDWARVFIVAVILIAAIVVNVAINTHYADVATASRSSASRCGSQLLACVPLRPTGLVAAARALKGSIFSSPSSSARR